MKVQLDWQAYRDLEFGPQQPLRQAQQQAQPPKINFYDIWQIALSHLGLTSEPKVWKTQDETGQPAWSAYDPRTGRSIHQVSADRVRAWLRL